MAWQDQLRISATDTFGSLARRSPHTGYAEAEKNKC